jgi:hypothetical protein
VRRTQHVERMGETQISMKEQQGNLNGKRTLQAPKRGQENSIKIDLNVIG